MSPLFPLRPKTLVVVSSPLLVFAPSREVVLDASRTGLPPVDRAVGVAGAVRQEGLLGDGEGAVRAAAGVGLELAHCFCSWGGGSELSDNGISVGLMAFISSWMNIQFWEFKRNTELLGSFGSQSKYDCVLGVFEL